MRGGEWSGFYLFGRRWFVRRVQPVCPKCGRNEVVMVIRYIDVTATVPIKDGRLRYGGQKYSGKRERFLRCMDCGNEWAYGLTGEEYV